MKPNLLRIWLPLSLFLLLGLSPGSGAPVSPTEAVAAADVWYAMELNTWHLGVDSAERIERLRRLGEHEVSYLVSADTVLDALPPGRVALAYIVKYQPRGLVVVAGDDRMNAILVFGNSDSFRWDQPEFNFLRHYLSTTVPARWAQLGEVTHRNWEYIRGKIGQQLEQVTFEPDAEYPVLWKTARWAQGQYYNTVVVSHTGNDQTVPTGCTATAMAIKMRFHSWPVPSGTSSHSYDDRCSGVLYSHTFNYGTWAPNWQNMPTNSLTSPNADVANLMYGSGVAVNMDYEPNWAGAWSSASSMNTYFRYKGTTNQSTPHEGPALTSIMGRLPVVASTSSHTVLLDGYMDPSTPYYHVNCGWNGGGDNWYYLSSVAGEGAVVKSNPYCQPANWYYVDSASTGTKDGNILTPYQTLSEGQSAVPVGGWLLIKEGTYTGTGNAPVTFSGAKTMVSYNAGTADLNHKLRLTKSGQIQITGAGRLKIY